MSLGLTGVAVAVAEATGGGETEPVAAQGRTPTLGLVEGGAVGGTKVQPTKGTTVALLPACFVYMPYHVLAIAYGYTLLND